MRVIVDRRERNEELIANLDALGIELGFDVLEVGDYVISDRICVERKTLGDLMSSIIDGRLFDQADRLRSAYEMPVVVVEGGRDEFRLNGKVLKGAVVALMLDHGIPVMESESPSQTAGIIAMMAAREQGAGGRMPSPKQGRRAHREEHYQEYVIGNLPGIGPRLAKALLTRFKTVRAIAEAGIEQLQEVDGIGRGKAERVHGLLNHRYSEAIREA